MKKRAKALDRVIGLVVDDPKLAKYVNRKTEKLLGRKCAGDQDEAWYRTKSHIVTTLLRDASVYNGTLQVPPEDLDDDDTDEEGLGAADLDQMTAGDIEKATGTC